MTSPSAPRPVVLAVDDKRSNLQGLEALLGDTYTLLFAKSGEEAVATLRQRADVDLVLLDVQMPGMDGFETAKAIKKLDGARDVPIIFVTAIYNEDPFIRKGYEVGGVDYFSKPFDPEVLRTKVAIYAAFRTREKVLRERERQVRESEELLRVGRQLSSVLQSLRVGVLIADLDGRIRQSSQEVSRILKADEPAGGPGGAGLPGWWDGVERLILGAGPLAAALQEGRSSPSERMSLQCLDGSSAQVMVCASPLHGPDRVLMGAVVLIQDLTEPRRLELALQEGVTRLVGAAPGEGAARAH